MNPLKSKLPDALTVGAIGTFVATHLAQINLVVQICAGLAAIAAACFAIRYHHRKTRLLSSLDQDSGV